MLLGSGTGVPPEVVVDEVLEPPDVEVVDVELVVEPPDVVDVVEPPDEVVDVELVDVDEPVFEHLLPPHQVLVHEPPLLPFEKIVASASTGTVVPATPAAIIEPTATALVNFMYFISFCPLPKHRIQSIRTKRGLLMQSACQTLKSAQLAGFNG